MKIRNRHAIAKFIKRELNATAPLKKWETTVRRAEWRSGADLASTYNTANLVAKDKWIFNIGGNKYRLAAMVWFSSRTVYILKVMTHAEYDRETWGQYQD